MPPAHTLLSLARLSKEALAEVFAQGAEPDAESLAGWEFKGHNTPWWAPAVGVMKFKKGFYKKEEGGAARYVGYNIPVTNSPLTEPWRCKPSDEDPKRFGYFSVVPARKARHPQDARRHPGALLLDYAAAPENPWTEPAKVLKDYLVQVDPASGDLFLGRAYLSIGLARVFSNFFILERDRKTNFAK